MVTKEAHSYMLDLKSEKNTSVTVDYDAAIIESLQRVIEGDVENAEQRSVAGRVPRVGECLLINEVVRLNSRIHGGRYEAQSQRRYFGRVSQIHPYVVVLQMSNGLYVSEKVSDFQVGLVKYIRLKSMPEKENAISYDERELENFIGSFEELLLR